MTDREQMDALIEAAELAHPMDRAAQIRALSASAVHAPIRDTHLYLMALNTLAVKDLPR